MGVAPQEETEDEFIRGGPSFWALKRSALIACLAAEVKGLRGVSPTPAGTWTRRRGAPL